MSNGLLMKYEEYFKHTKAIAKVVPKLRETMLSLDGKKLKGSLQVANGSVTTTYDTDTATVSTGARGSISVYDLFTMELNANTEDVTSIIAPNYSEFTFVKGTKVDVPLEWDSDDMFNPSDYADVDGSYCPTTKVFSVVVPEVGAMDYKLESKDDIEVMWFTLSSVMSRLMPLEQMYKVFALITLFDTVLQEREMVHMDADDINEFFTGFSRKIIFPRLSYV